MKLSWQERRLELPLIAFETRLFALLFIARTYMEYAHEIYLFWPLVGQLPLKYLSKTFNASRMIYLLIK